MSTSITITARRGVPFDRLIRRRINVAQYLLGINLCSLGVALAIDSGLGAAPYDTVLTGVSSAASIPFWLSAWLLTALWIAIVAGLGGSITVRQLLHGALFGPIIEFYLAVAPPPATVNWRVLYGILGVLGIAVGIHLFLSARLMSGVLDTLFATVSDRFDIDVNRVRWAFDALSVVMGLILGGAVGPLTIVVAVSVAPILGVLRTFDDRRAVVRSWRGIRLTD